MPRKTTSGKRWPTEIFAVHEPSQCECYCGLKERLQSFDSSPRIHFFRSESVRSLRVQPKNLRLLRWSFPATAVASPKTLLEAEAQYRYPWYAWSTLFFAARPTQRETGTDVFTLRDLCWSSAALTQWEFVFCKTPCQSNRNFVKCLILWWIKTFFTNRSSSFLFFLQR